MLETIFSWNTLYWLLVIIYFPACIGLIVIVLLQKGKNMGFAGAFGVNPGGDTVLGPRGARSLPVRMTYFMAGAFMVICILFALIEGRRQQGVAPEKVDAAEAAAMQDVTDELDALGVGQADPDAESTPSDVEAAPVDAAADAPEVDEAAAVEPDADSEDGSQTDAQAEVESMPEEDTP